MRDHVRILAILNILFGALGLLLGLGFLVFFSGIGMFAATQGGDPDAVLALPILGALGGFLFMLFAVFSVPGLVAGIGLLKMQSWGRILTIVLSALNLLNIPIGTALGAYGLWVLLNEETIRLFEAQRA